MSDQRGPQGPADPWGSSPGNDPWDAPSHHEGAEPIDSSPPPLDSSPPPPTAPWTTGAPGGPDAPDPLGRPGAPYDDSEYVVSSDGEPPQTAYHNAPDPFGTPPSPGRADTPPEPKKSGKRWLIPVAALVVLAVVGAAVYFLFIRPDADSSKDDAAASTSSTRSSEPSEGSGSSGSNESGSEQSGSGSPQSGGSSGDAAAAILGSYEVNGTIEAYTGPSGQLGASAKKPGDPVFKAPQTWSIEGTCADPTSCELPLSITPGDAKVMLTLDGETWKGSVTEPIQCDAAGQTAEATIAIEIPKAGGTAKRTVTAACSQPVSEIDNLTLTKK